MHQPSTAKKCPSGTTRKSAKINQLRKYFSTKDQTPGARMTTSKVTTHVRPERPEIRGTAQHNPPRPDRRHRSEHTEPRRRLQRPRPTRQGQGPALQQRADGRQHLKRCAIQVLDQHPRAGGSGTCEGSGSPGEFSGHVGAGVGAEEGLAVGLVVEVKLQEGSG